MCPNLRTQGPPSREGLSEWMPQQPLSFSIQLLSSIPVCQTLPDLSGLPQGLACSFWHGLSNDTPVSTATPLECQALIRNDRSAHRKANIPLTRHRPRCHRSDAECNHFMLLLCARGAAISLIPQILKALLPAGFECARSISTGLNSETADGLQQSLRLSSPSVL